MGHKKRAQELRVCQNRRRQFDICAVNVLKTTALHRNHLVSVLNRLWDLNMLVLSSQLFNYVGETLYKHALEHLEAGRLEKMGEGNDCTERLTIINLFESL